MKNRKIPLSVAIGMSVLLTACATSPDNEMLNEARSSYQEIKDNPNVARAGSNALREAQKHLRNAEQLLEEEADDELVEHEAYLAERYVEVAKTQGERAEIQQQITQAEQRRRELRLEMQSAEAQRAQSQAQQAQSEAEELRQQLQELKNMQAQQTDRGMVVTLGDLLFDLNKATLQRPAQQSIDKLASFLREHEDRRVRVEGYTDTTGTEEYNQQLSEERARAVKQALVDQGIAADRIETKGFGEAYPVASNEDAAGRARNRRVEIVFSDPEGNIGTR